MRKCAHGPTQTRSRAWLQVAPSEKVKLTHYHDPARLPIPAAGRDNGRRPPRPSPSETIPPISRLAARFWCAGARYLR